MATERVVAILVATFLVSVSSAAVSETQVAAVISAEDSETELKLVTLVWRHGDRTPDLPTYPNDPYQNNPFAPYGLGQLTLTGYNRGYNNGKFFRKRYDAFLGPLYNQFEVRAQSTGMPRTRMSLQLWCAGLFPPVNTNFEWKQNLNWQPCDFTAESLDNDPLLFPLGLNCPRFNEEVVGVFGSYMTENKAVMDILKGYTGLAFQTPFDSVGIYNALKTEYEYGLPLPTWAKDYYPDKLRLLSNKAWALMVSNTALKRIMAGKLLQKMIADWEAKIANTLSEKLFLFSAHDITIVSVLAAFNVWSSDFTPDYGNAAVFELRQNRNTGEYGVQVYYRAQPANEPKLLTIPGCQSFCPLSQLKTLLNDNLPTPTDCNAI